jgi:hypothetical protein
MIKVKTQETNNAQARDIPNCEPVEAIVVTLPVPILYPIRKIPEPTAIKNPLNLFQIEGISEMVND